MPNDFIQINMQITTATHASLLKQYVTVLRQAYELGLEAKGIMDHNFEGTDFTALETLFGLLPGDGQLVYDMVNGSVGAMEGLFQTPDAKNITERVG